MSDIENPRSWNITINQNVVIFLSDLNADDDTVTSTSQFIREEVIFTPAAGTLSTYAYMYFWFFMVSGWKQLQKLKSVLEKSITQ